MLKYTLFIGIDISKKWIDVSLSTNGDKSQMPHQRFDNEQKGFTQMLAFIAKHYPRYQNTAHWLFCLEHTGLYGDPLRRFLEAGHLTYVIESGKAISNSLGLRRGKSDKADSADIARYAFLHQNELSPSKLPCDTLRTIKNLLSLRRRLVKARQGIKVAAKELRNFTEVEDCIGSISDQTCNELSAHIKSIELKIVATIQQSEKLYALYKLLISIKGVGLITAAYLLVYTKGFTAFKTARQFACYIGIAPFQYSSGSSIKKPDRVSHLANKTLKTLISAGAISAIRFDKQIKAYYNRRVGEGKNPFLVQNNVKNKLVYRIFAVVKRGTPYVELYQFNS